MSNSTEPEVITLKKSDLLKAHSEGCSATKKALENLYPAVFLPPILNVKERDIVQRIGDDFKGHLYIVLPRLDVGVKLDLYCLTDEKMWWGCEAADGIPSGDFKIIKEIEKAKDA